MSSIDFGFVEDVEAVDVGYPDVRVPTLILHGVKDDVVPIERSRTFAADKPWVRLVELPDGVRAPRTSRHAEGGPSAAGAAS